MRFVITAALAVVLCVIAPARSSAQMTIDGFGALPVDHLSSFGDSTLPIDFGGRVSFDVLPAVQLVGEFGRIGNVLPGAISLPLSFTRFDVRMSAFYGEGGVRLLAAPRSAVTPYVEGTAGVAHMRFGATGFGSTTDALIRAAMNLVDTRDPMFGAGGGVLLRGGPLHVDVGYRYKRIVPNSTFSSLLGFGQQLETHQLRFGAGVRF
jgi:hypothetical protein